MSYTDDQIALQNWCSFFTDDERPEIAAAEMPSDADREALRTLVAAKPHLEGLPTRLADLLAKQGVNLTYYQVMKSLSADAGDDEYERWAPRR